MSDQIIHESKQRMMKSVQHTGSEMSRIRTGKATPILLESIKVDYYGTPTPVNQIANVNTPEARLLVILPYDKSMLGAVEKAILASDLGLTPQNDGSVIRLPIPMLTAERREELVKHIKRLAEDGRISIRNIRRDANDQVKKAEKASDISKDEAKRLMDNIQKDTDEYISELDQILKAREEEIREE
ncbi:ribosome recycling factor [bacterium]|nr:ribosome recycling factor [bacterium]